MWGLRVGVPAPFSSAAAVAGRVLISDRVYQLSTIIVIDPAHVKEP